MAFFDQPSLLLSRLATSPCSEVGDGFELLVEFVSDSAVIASMGGSILFANSSALTTTGYSFVELAKRSIDELVVSPLFRSLLVENAQALWRELPLVLMNQPIRKQDNQTLIADIAIAPILYRSKPAVMLVIKATAGLDEICQSVESTVQEMTRLIEERDPCTAEHQRRVSALATAIAREMQLDQQEIEGIRFAGLLHDIGKIAIPQTILNRPGSLSDLEYEIVKKHPQTAYEMLKGLQSPWPIAEMVLQHHERMDGSGYPRGLVGRDILVPARILAVADVVEATASERPYRPALGLHGALRELRKGYTGRLDTVVVEACHTALKGRSSLVL